MFKVPKQVYTAGFTSPVTPDAVAPSSRAGVHLMGKNCGNHSLPMDAPSRCCHSPIRRCATTGSKRTRVVSVA